MIGDPDAALSLALLGPRTFFDRRNAHPDQATEAARRATNSHLYPILDKRALKPTTAAIQEQAISRRASNAVPTTAEAPSADRHDSPDLVYLGKEDRALALEHIPKLGEHLSLRSATGSASC
jgi:hypothetical protein